MRKIYSTSNGEKKHRRNTQNKELWGEEIEKKHTEQGVMGRRNRE
jgi:hypothetical protein